MLKQGGVHGTLSNARKASSGSAGRRFVSTRLLN